MEWKWCAWLATQVDHILWISESSFYCRWKFVVDGTFYKLKVLKTSITHDKNLVISHSITSVEPRAKKEEYFGAVKGQITKVNYLQWIPWPQLSDILRIFSRNSIGHRASSRISTVRKIFINFSTGEGKTISRRHKNFSWYKLPT